ncbi:hypothetical protein VTO42DRAFT_2682 [Malbranchea cinnamomea]
MVSITLPDNYGNVVAVAVGVIPLLGFVHGNIVNKTRRAANIPYPHTYATQEQCKADPNAEKFNCAQRAHANFLENMSQTVVSILVAGVKYPTAATLLGISWVAFRALFLYGYVYSKKPRGAGRLVGAPFWLVQGALWAISVFGVGLPMMGPIWGRE